jgi:hypothetical protein
MHGQGQTGDAAQDQQSSCGSEQPRRRIELRIAIEKSIKGRKGKLGVKREEEKATVG